MRDISKSSLKRRLDSVVYLKEGDILQEGDEYGRGPGYLTFIVGTSQSFLRSGDKVNKYLLSYHPIRPLRFPSKSSSLGWDELFMRHVYLIASKSKDLSTHVGSVLVKERRVVSEGFNGLPMKVRDDISVRHERPIKYLVVVHAEANSVLTCARFGVVSNGTTCYTQGMPCGSCAGALIQGGIEKIVLHKQWTDHERSLRREKWEESARYAAEMFLEAQMEVFWFDKVLGLKGFLDGKEVGV